jgi:hypothetical protein
MPHFLSSNGKPSEANGLDPQTADFIKKGFDVGKSGAFDRPAVP